MGFQDVYKYLTEKFPGVDHRILRAVALENPKHLHVAIDVVVTEVFPRVNGHRNLPLKDPRVEFTSKIEDENKTKMDSLGLVQTDMYSSDSGIIGGEASDNTIQESGVAHLDTALDQSVSVNNYVANDDCEQSRESTKTTSLTMPADIQEDSREIGFNHVAPGKSNGLVHDYGGHEQIGQIARTFKQVTENIKQDETLFDGVGGKLNYFDSAFLHDENMLEFELSCARSKHNFLSADENFDSQIVNPSIENRSPVQSEIHLLSDFDNQKSDANGTSNPCRKQECSTGKMSANEDKLMGGAKITLLDQPCSFELLDEIMEDAKSNKINLFSVMQSVVSKMRELEHKEKCVEKAKEEAAYGESKILAKVEGMKQIVAHSKEANDMHAGEVFGEKAILATETRELQSRLLSLSNKKNRSLSVLDEMYTTLEARIAAVDTMLKEIEEEKLAKEERAEKALAEQEALLAKVLQQSRKLRMEAEENSKLREFLNQRGKLVDVLQGEVSVICEDVMLLKEKFDMEVPLSKSISSNQTSFILASSGSSRKSAACDTDRICLSFNDILPSLLDAENGASLNPRKERSQPSSVSSSNMSSNDVEEERGKNHSNVFSDDGWDVLDFDKDAEVSEAPYFLNKN